VEALAETKFAGNSQAAAQDIDAVREKMGKKTLAAWYKAGLPLDI
jgi:hypothetical protein